MKSKKTVFGLILLLLCSTLKLSAQELIFESNLKKIHDLNKHNGAADAAGPWGLYAYPDNNAAGLVWGYDHSMEAYALLAKSTYLSLSHRQEYFKTLIRMFSRILDVRDDNTTNPDYWGRSGAWWNNNHYQGFHYGDIGHSGMLTYPMALFCEYILNPANSGIASTLFIKPSSFDSPRYNNMTYYQIAIDLRERIIETVEEHINANQLMTESKTINGTSYLTEYFIFQQAPGSGFLHGSDSYDNLCPVKRVPINIQAAMSRAILYLWKALEHTADPRTTIYRDHSIKLALNLKSVLVPVGVHYVWPYGYGCGYDPASPSNTMENGDHAILEMDYMYHCYLQNVPVSVGGSSVFNSTDMSYLAGTANENYTGNPLQFAILIDGSGGIYSNASHVAYLTPFAQWDGRIYHRSTDPMLRKTLGYLSPDPYIPGNTQTHSTVTMFEFSAISHMAIYGKLNGFKMRPLNVSRDPGNGSQWIATEGGDLNADGIENEYVAVRKYDQTFYVYRTYDNGDIIYQASQFVSPGPLVTDAWIDLCVGNLSTSHPGDEIAAVRNYNGYEHFILYRVTGSSLTEIARYNGYGNGSIWAGICSADLDGNGQEEMVGIRNNPDGVLARLYYNNTTSLASGGSLATNISTWKNLESGDIDNDGKDEIVGITSNGVVHIYYYDGGILKEGIISGSLGIVPRSASLADFDRNKKDDDLIIGDMSAYFRKYKIIYTGLSGGLRSYTITGQASEQIDITYFTTAMVLGHMSQAQKNCDEDKLIIIRNSVTDGHMFVYDAGYTKDISWECIPQGGGSKAPAESDELQETDMQTVVFPNPNNGNFDLTIPAIDTQANIRIFDLQGHQVYSVTTTTSTNQINLENVVKGVYIIQVENGTETKHIKIIIQ